MADQVVQQPGTVPSATTVLGGSNDNTSCLGLVTTTEAIGNASQHMLNANHVTQKAVADIGHHTMAQISSASRDILLDNANTRLQLASISDTIRTDGSSTRAEVRSEGRNLDNKICMLEKEVMNQAERTRERIDAVERRGLERQLDDAKLSSALAPIVAQLAQLQVSIGNSSTPPIR